jgi:hypothetical protein
MSAPYSEDPAEPRLDELKLYASEAMEMELRHLIYGLQDDLCQVNELLMNMAEQIDQYLDDNPWPRDGDPTEAPPPDDPTDYNSIPF